MNTVRIAILLLLGTIEDIEDVLPNRPTGVPRRGVLKLRYSAKQVPHVELLTEFVQNAGPANQEAAPFSVCAKIVFGKVLAKVVLPTPGPP